VCVCMCVCVDEMKQEDPFFDESDGYPEKVYIYTHMHTYIRAYIHTYIHNHMPKQDYESHDYP
jgi:hypothetical protein